MLGKRIILTTTAGDSCGHLLRSVVNQQSLSNQTQENQPKVTLKPLSYHYHFKMKKMMVFRGCEGTKALFSTKGFLEKEMILERGQKDKKKERGEMEREVDPGVFNHDC